LFTFSSKLSISLSVRKAILASCLEFKNEYATSISEALNSEDNVSCKAWIAIRKVSSLVNSGFLLKTFSRFPLADCSFSPAAVA
jgi:hypothetical protein